MDSYLFHHGIKGQKWGKRNGPPYPLDEETHERVIEEGGEARNWQLMKELSDSQKRALKIGVAALATAVAAYGLYRLANVDPKIIEEDRNMINKAGDEFADNANGIKKVSEPFGASLRLVNPNCEVSEAYRTNCLSCSMSGVLRRLGFRVSAKPERSLQGLPMIKTISECFQTKDGKPLKVSNDDYT